MLGIKHPCLEPFLVEKDFNFGLLAIVVAGPPAGFSFWLVHRRRQNRASACIKLDAASALQHAVCGKLSL